jgi:hypothetical protein
VVFSRDYFPNDSEGWIVRIIGDKDYFVSWIILFEERREIVSQAIVQATTRRDNGGKGSEIRKRTADFSSQVGRKAKTVAKRKNANPDDYYGEEIEYEHYALCDHQILTRQDGVHDFLF